MTPIQLVLFDLDGTLLDTAPDLIYALNYLRKEHNLSELSLSTMRPIASLGSKAMIKHAFDIDESNKYFNILREKFLALYEEHLADSTQFFPGVNDLLVQLEEKKVPWGIVTNKLTRHTMPLLQALNLSHRPACIICGDTLATYKPDPEPILYACRSQLQNPNHCIYIGDAATDVIASKAAGTKSLVALYGYISQEDNPLTWQADGYVNTPLEVLDWM